jgi:hypothetical protein
MYPIVLTSDEVTEYWASFMGNYYDLLRQINVWHPRLPEVKDWNARIHGR